MILTEEKIDGFIDDILKSVNKSLPKGIKFEDLTNKEKSEFFNSHTYDGKRWIKKGLIHKVKNAITTAGKGAIVGVTTPDRLIPGLERPNNKLTKSMSYLTRAAVLTLPGGLPIGIALGMIFGSLNPDKVDKSYEVSKRLATSKIKSLLKLGK
jgi:hypothetical protein